MPTLTPPPPTTLDAVERVFRRVRDVFIWTADKEVFGKPEHWESLAHLIHAGAHQAKGDCDDFALTCLELLAEAGAPTDTLRIILCWTETDDYHCVAGVDHESGTWILDNRQRRVLDFPDLRGYRWEKSMRLSDAGNWVYIDLLARAPAP
jgi:predicted transglutaminase-like cysteine proteinase